MRPVQDIIIKPFGDRYNNTCKVGDKDLILNTEIFNHQYVNRKAIVFNLPIYNPLGLRKDLSLIHI